MLCVAMCLVMRFPETRIAMIGPLEVVMMQHGYRRRVFSVGQAQKKYK